jgi:phage gpG-like protein
MAGGGFKVELFGQWNVATVALMTSANKIKTASNRALMQEAQYLRKQIVQGIRDQAPGGKAFKPLKQSTIERRRRAGFTGTKALIRTGDLRNSIAVKRAGTNGVFVGILRTATSRGGDILVNLAKIHEYGAPRANIPARPFFGPVFDAEKDKIQERFAKNMAKNLGGMFGTGMV